MVVVVVQLEYSAKFITIKLSPVILPLAILHWNEPVVGDITYGLKLLPSEEIIDYDWRLIE